MFSLRSFGCSRSHGPKHERYVTYILIGYSKYCTVSVNDCVSLYLRPVMTWRFVQGEPPPVALCQLGEAPAPPTSLQRMIGNGWILFVYIGTKTVFYRVCRNNHRSIVLTHNCLTRLSLH